MNRFWIIVDADGQVISQPFWKILLRRVARTGYGWIKGEPPLTVVDFLDKMNSP